MLVRLLGRNVWLGCALLIFVIASALMWDEGYDYKLGAFGAYSLLAVVGFVIAVAICKLIREGRGEDVGFGETPLERCAVLALFGGAGALSAALWMPAVLGWFGNGGMIFSALIFSWLAWLACAKDEDIPSWARLSGRLSMLESVGSVAPFWARAGAIASPFVGMAGGALIPVIFV